MSATQPPSLPTIPEAEATGEIAELYADLRAVLGVPVVNLIYRHIAALPGCLAWSWSRLRPLYGSGAVERAADRLVRGLRLPPVERLTSARLARAGVPAQALGTVRSVLETYHRANPMNLLALTVLRTDLEGHGGSVAGATAAPGGPAAGPDESEGGAAGLPGPVGAGAIPPLVPLSALAPDTAHLAWRLAALGVHATPGEMPSAWLNLAHWPGYLALALERLQPLADSGWLAREMDGLRLRRDPLARHLLAARVVAPSGGESPESPEPIGAERAALSAAVVAFTEGLIPRMIPLLAALRAAHPLPPRDPAQSPQPAPPAKDPSG